MKGQLGNLMQQAQQMQESLKQAQQELGDLEATGEAGGGMVKVTMNGRNEVTRVNIEDGAMDDREMLEDLITAAANQAVARIREASQEKMSEATGGMQLPPGLFGG